MQSIRRKLLLTLIGALLLAGFSTAAATFFSAQAEFNEFLDSHLQDTAESLASNLSFSEHEHDFKSLKSTTPKPTRPGTPRMPSISHYQIHLGLPQKSLMDGCGAFIQWSAAPISSPWAKIWPYAPNWRVPRPSECFSHSSFYFPLLRSLFGLSSGKFRAHLHEKITHGARRVGDLH